MNGFHFFKVSHRAATDLRWLGIGRKLGLSPMLVAGFFTALLDYASQQDDRGSLQGLPLRDLAAFADLSVEQLQALYDEFVADGRITADHRLANWAKHQHWQAPAATNQPPVPMRRPAKSNAQRAKESRDRKKQTELTLSAPMPAAAVTSDSNRHETDSPRHETRHENESQNVTNDSFPNADSAPPSQEVDGIPSRKSPESEKESDSRDSLSGGARELREPYAGVDGIVVLERVDPVLVEFRLWWARCENQVDETAALFEYRRARAAGATAAEIAEGWARYVAARAPDQYWASPAGFLKKRRWTDRPAAIGPPAGLADPAATGFSPSRGRSDDRSDIRRGAGAVHNPRSAAEFAAARDQRRATLAAEVDRRMAHRDAARRAG